MIVRLHHAQITLPTGAEDEGRRFYCELLGLTEIAKPDALAGRGGFWLQVGAQQVHVSVEDEDWRRRTRAHLAYEVDDWDALRAKLEAAGIAVGEDVPLPGQRRGQIRDPFGNRVEFVQTLE